jgi:hypothetical protein
MKTGLKIFLILVAFFILLIVGKIVLYPFFVADKAVDTAYDVTKKTLDADNVLENYHWFKQQVQDFNGIEKQIQDMEQQVESFKQEAGSRKDWTFVDKDQYQQMTTNLIGLKQQRENIRKDYNARSQMYDRALFKTKDLPYEL